ncbi:hypothetical protein QBC33DRAFT_609500 [Phialemonium atrogriseum]|uniref:Uncharacterized protein n=1 Tax=Phialemonium atrogriseum TaxID=1093897 RepID=A0AAJ0C4U3_9PEZI|nr:uncharacterized protein QBC33DRAFT_609500 [Phialemonium atrogriseum]KAK1770168.1 hypothetical protein QBC33DRAFT_609500 [Phialemonium atrogriseum]
MSALNLQLDILDDAEMKHSAPQGSIATTAAGLLKPFKSVKGAPKGTNAEIKFANLLRDYVQLGDKRSVEDIAKEILAILPANGQYSTEMSAFSQLCVEIAVQIPYHHPSQMKLAYLLQYLARSPKFVSTSTLPGVEVLTHSYQALGEVIRDNLQGPQAEETPMAWVNYHAFFAHFESIVGRTTSSPTYAIWTMREAFEGVDYTKEEFRDYYIMAAAYASRVAESDEKSWRLGSLLKDEKRSMGLLSLERWRFWADGFKAVAADEKSSDECRSLSGKAPRLMDAMEMNMTF